MEKLFTTYGFDLEDILRQTDENGNADFAKVIREQIARLQGVYDVLAQKHAATGDENIWNIDAEYAKSVILAKIPAEEPAVEDVPAE